MIVRSVNNIGKKLYNLLFDFVYIGIVFEQYIYVFYESTDLNVNGFVAICDSFLAFRVGELRIESVYILSFDAEFLLC